MCIRDRLSFTRSLYGALGLTAVLSITAVLILCPAGRKRVLAFLLAVVVCFGVMSTVQEIVLEGKMCIRDRNTHIIRVLF